MPFPFKNEHQRNFTLLVAACVTLLLAAIVVCTTVSAIYRFNYPSQYWDQWDYLRAYFLQIPKGNLFGWLFRFNNEHRIAFPQLFFLVDLFLFSGKNIFLSTITTISLFLLSFLIGFRKTKPVIYNVISIGMVSVLLFSFSQSENLMWGFQIQFYLVYLLAFISIKTITESDSYKSIVTALLTTFLATYSMSNGLLLIPFLIATTIFRKLQPRKTLLIILSCIVIGLSYFLIPSTNTPSRILPATDLDIVRCFTFFISSLGNPIGRTNTLVSQMIGIIILFYWIYLGILLWRQNEKTSINVTLYLFASFAIMSFAAIAYGRWECGLNQASAVRYATPALLVQSALFALSMHLIKSTKPVFSKCLLFVMLGLQTLFAIELATKQPNYIELYKPTYVRKLLALNAIQNSCFDPLVVPVLHPNIAIHSITLKRLKNNSNWSSTHTHPKGRVSSTLKKTKQIGSYVLVKSSPLGENGDPFLFKGEISEFNVTNESSFWLCDEEQNYIGSCYEVKNHPDIWPFNGDPNSSGFKLYGHLNRKPNSEQLFVVERRTNECVACLAEAEIHLKQPYLVPKQYSERKPSVASALVLSMEQTWTPNGIYNQAKKASFQDDFQVWGSWSGDDANTGSIVLNCGIPAQTSVIQLPYITGPVHPNATVTIEDATTNEQIRSFHLLKTNGVWKVVDIKLPQQTRRINISISEEGKKWGQWVGVAFNK